MSLVCCVLQDASNVNYTTEEAESAFRYGTCSSLPDCQKYIFAKEVFIMLDLLLHGGLDIWKQQLSTTIHTINSDPAHLGVKTKTL